MKGFARVVPELESQAAHATVSTVHEPADARPGRDEAARQRREELLHLMTRLTQPERDVIALHFGLDGLTGLNGPTGPTASTRSDPTRFDCSEDSPGDRLGDRSGLLSKRAAKFAGNAGDARVARPAKQRDRHAVEPPSPGTPPSLEAIGKTLGLSRHRVRQIERSALTKLREAAELRR
jgi:RNA polymerase sigma factor (sigma-70 family)